MNDALKMQISAFVDGELPENEAELLLRRLSQDTALRQQVSRYLEVGRAMRREREVAGMDQLRGRIAAALGEEAVDKTEEPQVVGSRLMTPTTGVAVAATVAALALVGLSQLGGPNDPSLDGALAIDDGPAGYTEPDIDSALAEQPSELLLQYYLKHGDSAGTNGVLVLPTTLEVSDIIETEPDPHLLSGDGDDVDETDTP